MIKSRIFARSSFFTLACTPAISEMFAKELNGQMVFSNLPCADISDMQFNALPRTKHLRESTCIFSEYSKSSIISSDLAKYVGKTSAETIVAKNSMIECHSVSC